MQPLKSFKDSDTHSYLSYNLHENESEENEEDNYSYDPGTDNDTIFNDNTEESNDAYYSEEDDRSEERLPSSSRKLPNNINPRRRNSPQFNSHTYPSNEPTTSTDQGELTSTSISLFQQNWWDRLEGTSGVNPDDEVLLNRDYAHDHDYNYDSPAKGERMLKTVEGSSEFVKLDSKLDSSIKIEREVANKVDETDAKEEEEISIPSLSPFVKRLTDLENIVNLSASVSVSVPVPDPLTNEDIEESAPPDEPQPIPPPLPPPTFNSADKEEKSSLNKKANQAQYENEERDHEISRLTTLLNSSSHSSQSENHRQSSEITRLNSLINTTTTSNTELNQRLNQTTSEYAASEQSRTQAESSASRLLLQVTSLLSIQENLQTKLNNTLKSEGGSRDERYNALLDELTNCGELLNVSERNKLRVEHEVGELRRKVGNVEEQRRLEKTYNEELEKKNGEMKRRVKEVEYNSSNNAERSYRLEDEVRICKENDKTNASKLNALRDSLEQAESNLRTSQDNLRRSEEKGRTLKSTHSSEVDYLMSQLTEKDTMISTLDRKSDYSMSQLAAKDRVIDGLERKLTVNEVDGDWRRLLIQGKRQSQSQSMNKKGAVVGGEDDDDDGDDELERELEAQRRGVASVSVSKTKRESNDDDDVSRSKLKQREEQALQQQSQQQQEREREREREQQQQQQQWQHQEHENMQRDQQEQQRQQQQQRRNQEELRETAQKRQMKYDEEQRRFNAQLPPPPPARSQMRESQEGMDYKPSSSSSSLPQVSSSQGNPSLLLPSQPPLPVTARSQFRESSQEGSGNNYPPPHSTSIPPTSTKQTQFQPQYPPQQSQFQFQRSETHHHHQQQQQDDHPHRQRRRSSSPFRNSSESFQDANYDNHNQSIRTLQTQQTHGVSTKDMNEKDSVNYTGRRLIATAPAMDGGMSGIMDGFASQHSQYHERDGERQSGTGERQSRDGSNNSERLNTMNHSITNNRDEHSQANFQSQIHGIKSSTVGAREGRSMRKQIDQDIDPSIGFQSVLTGAYSTDDAVPHSHRDGGGKRSPSPSRRRIGSSSDTPGRHNSNDGNAREGQHHSQDNENTANRSLDQQFNHNLPAVAGGHSQPTEHPPRFSLSKNKKPAENVPFATDQNVAKVRRTVENQEDDLMKLGIEGGLLKAEFEKLSRGKKTAKAMTRCSELEIRLEEIGKRQSKLRRVLKEINLELGIAS